jgi:hypothetical protein
MEDKRGTKHAHSPSKGESSSPDGAKTPPPAPSRSLPPLMSPSEVSSCCLRSPVWEQGGSSGKAPVVDLSLSSDEGDFIADVSQDKAFTRRLFDNLNCHVLGPPDDDKIIILSDSDEEEEVHEEKAINVEVAPSSAIRYPASTASASVDDAPMEAKNDNSDDRTPDQEADGSNDSGDNARLP